MKTESQTAINEMLLILLIWYLLEDMNARITFYLLSKDKGQRFVMNYYRQAELKNNFEQNHYG
jgi:hypothetical protein